MTDFCTFQMIGRLAGDTSINDQGYGYASVFCEGKEGYSLCYRVYLSGNVAKYVTEGIRNGLYKKGDTIIVRGIPYKMHEGSLVIHAQETHYLYSPGGERKCFSKSPQQPTTQAASKPEDAVSRYIDENYLKNQIPDQDGYGLTEL